MNRLLLVDDDPAVLGQVQSCLGDTAELSVALNADDALRVARCWHPDLVLLDWHLGVPDGMALMRSFRADAELAGLPVLFISADGATAGQVQALELGALDFLTKPLVPELFAARVRSALRRCQPAAADAPPAPAPEAPMLAYLLHEIGNPLHGMAGLCQLLLLPGGEPLSPRQRRLLELMDSSAAQMRRLLGDALDYARAQNGRFEVQLQPVALAPVLDSLLATLQPLADECGVSLPTLHCPGWHVLADALRLRQCLHNLLSNACKYGHSEVQVALRRDAGLVAIEVRDDGPGIAAHMLPRLFQPFDRLGCPQAAGHGLGLALTRQLAEAMGGRLTVHTAPGEGSSFTLALPASEAAS